MTFGSSLRSTPVILNLLIINFLIFFAQLIIGESLTERLALWPWGNPNFRLYQIITHMFTHGSWGHILFNMFALWSFGSILENRWGGRKFLIFYFLCGLAAAVSQMMFSHEPAVGASGAIMGLLAAFAYLYPNLTLFMFPIPFPIKAKYAIIVIAAIDIFGGLNTGSDNIAHLAHLGGLLMGFLLVMLRKNVYY